MAARRRSTQEPIRSQLSSLTADDARLLEVGLTTLEAAMAAARQPIPERLDHLRRRLQRWPSVIGGTWPAGRVMKTGEVARQLGVSLQQVQQLGKKGDLVIAQAGHRGRNGSALYTTESVRRYAENRPLPGRKPQREG